MLKEIVFNSEYFNAKDTLECGQIFRFFQIDNGYLVLSGEKACILNTVGDKTTILCESENEEYFYNYFDLSTDYSAIFSRAQKSEFEILKIASKLGKGVRILRQNCEEMVFSFLISQNNNIPRIKKAVNTISERLGDKKEFMGHTYYAFPSVEKICAKDESFFKECGLGYRAEYVKIVANELKNGMLNKIYNFNENDIKQELIKIKGIGEKVADCICLFGLYKTRSFPVDVWIEKIYRENFNGKLTNRKQITNYFVDQFGYDAGYFQQYLFYYKRSLEK